MGRRRFSDKQRLEVLAELDAGTSVQDLSRKHQLSAGATIYKWKKDKATDEDEAQRRLRELEAENKRLKKMYAELRSIDHDILKTGYGMLKKWQATEDEKNK